MAAFSALKRFAGASALALGLISGPALASGLVAVTEDPVVMVPAADPAYDWSGFYAGLSYSGISGSATASPVPNFAFFVDSSNWGAFVGYNMQRGNFVFGGEFAYTALNTPLVGYPVTFQRDVMELRLRGGYAMDRVLAYGFVGAASSSLIDGATVFNQTGYSFGFGVQTVLRNNVLLGLELARREVAGTTFGNTVDSRIDTVSLRVGYQF